MDPRLGYGRDLPAGQGDPRDLRLRGEYRGRSKKLILQPERLFALRLAKATGRLTEPPEDILDDLTGPQLAELRAFDRLEGIDEAAHWQRLEAILAMGFCAVANLLIVKGQKFEPENFIPKKGWQIQTRRQPPAASVHLQKAVLRQIAAQHNAARY